MLVITRRHRRGGGSGRAQSLLERHLADIFCLRANDDLSNFVGTDGIDLHIANRKRRGPDCCIIRAATVFKQ